MHRTFKSNIITNGSIKKDPKLFGKYSKSIGAIHETDDTKNVVQNDKKKKKKQRNLRRTCDGRGMKWTRNISEN
jgi:hypothetical protein